MTNEKYLLKVFTNRDVLYNHWDLIPERFNDKHITEILRLFKTYFDADHSAEVIGQPFLVWLSSAGGKNFAKSTLDVLIAIVEDILDYTLPDVVVTEVIKEIRLSEVASELAHVANSVVDGKMSPSDLTKCINWAKEESINIENANAKDESWKIRCTLAEVEANMATDGVINFSSQWMKDALPFGFPREAHVVIAGVPNSGKTSYAIAEALNLVKSMGKNEKVILINNEESSWRIYQRAYSIARYFWGDIKDISHRFEVWEHKSWSIEQYAEALSKEPNVGVVIFNTVDKQRLPKGNGSSNGVGELETLYKLARSICKVNNCVVFSIGQAGINAANKEVVTQADLYMGKTVKDAEADLLITIGKLDEDLKQGYRYISLVKNKFYPTEFYGREVEFIRDIGVFVDV